MIFKSIYFDKKFQMKKLLILMLFIPPLSIFAQKDTTFWRDNAILRAGELEITFKIKDYKHYASLNHPKLVEMIGGEAAFANMLEEQMTTLEQSIKIDSMDFGDPYQFTKCANDSVINCLLPQTMLIRLDDTLKMRSTVYLLGVSEDMGNTWYFLDASNGEGYLDALVPNRCKDFIIPKRQQVKITEKKKE
jgi:hypothetical protein